MNRPADEPQPAECVTVRRPEGESPKLTSTDIERAVSQYQAGDSLATVGKTLKVDASTSSELLSGPVKRFDHGPNADAPGRPVRDLRLLFQTPEP